MIFRVVIDTNLWIRIYQTAIAIALYILLMG